MTDLNTFIENHPFNPKEEDKPKEKTFEELVIEEVQNSDLKHKKQIVDWIETYRNSERSWGNGDNSNGTF